MGLFSSSRPDRPENTAEPVPLPPSRQRDGNRLAIVAAAVAVALVVAVAMIGSGASDSEDPQPSSTGREEPVSAAPSPPASMTSSPRVATVSAACAEAFATAAAVPGLDADAEIRATLTACSTYEEWVAGLRAEPGALGLTHRAAITGPMEVASSCYKASAPVCDDARAVGVLNSDGSWND